MKGWGLRGGSAVGEVVNVAGNEGNGIPFLVSLVDGLGFAIGILAPRIGGFNIPNKAVGVEVGENVGELDGNFRRIAAMVGLYLAMGINDLLVEKFAVKGCDCRPFCFV